MSLFEKPEPQAPKPENAARRLKNMANNNFDQLVQMCNQATKLFWDHPHFTPEEIWGGLGADAIPVFNAHAALVTAITTAKPDQELDDSTTYGWTYTIDPNTGAFSATKE